MPTRYIVTFLGQGRKKDGEKGRRTPFFLLFFCVCLKERDARIFLSKKEKNMKNTMKKISAVLLILAMLGLLLALVACQKEPPLVVEKSDTCVVFATTEKALEGQGEMTLLALMEKQKEAGEIDFTVENGMITSLNGIENPADFSKCWMLYISDVDNANEAWGTVEYEGVVYGSAIYGADSLILKPDCLYIFIFKSFE